MIAAAVTVIEGDAADEDTVRDAMRHGRETPSLACVDYEAILPLPLDEARRVIGARATSAVHVRGIPEPGATLRAVERNVELV